jgi:hypothetical protein
MTEEQRSPVFLAAVRILYGEAWLRAFCRDFDVARRTARRWADGSAYVPDGIMAEMEQALRDHGQKLDALLDHFAAEQTPQNATVGFGFITPFTEE